MDPSVSVIIPAYNAEHTIGSALDSVFAQTRPVQEVIVVNDGSTDSTAEVAQRYEQVRLINSNNGGPSRARNLGIAAAESQWVAFLDADDRWHPEKMARQLAVVADRAEVGLVACDWERWLASTPAPVSGTVALSDIGFRDLLVLNRFQTSTVLVRKTILDELGGFDPDVDGAEDWDMWLRISRLTAIVKVNWPLVMYRDVDNGYSKDVWRVFATMLPMLQKHQDAPGVTRSQYRTIVAWHHLRFMVAFLLQKNRAQAWEVWAHLRRQGLAGSAARASGQYLLPFLWSRMERRWTRH